MVTIGRGSEIYAADYDLIVKGGRVIDPSLHVDAIREFGSEIPILGVCLGMLVGFVNLLKVTNVLTPRKTKLEEEPPER